MEKQNWNGMGVSYVCGLDIGGTLAKVVIFVPHMVNVNESYQYLSESRFKRLTEKLKRVAWVEEDLALDVEGGSLLFLKYLSSKADLAAKITRELGLIPEGTVVHATGGGAFKHEGLMKKNLKLDLEKHDEMESLVQGLRLMAKVEGECFELRNILFHGDRGRQRERLETSPIKLSEGFLVVNIGSGVSFVHCTDTTYERVGGSSLGGSTFLGLCALLTGEDHFDTLVELATNGDSAMVDMLVADIYGKDGNIYGLKPTTLASSFGKMINRKFRQKVTKADLVLSTLIMISMNVAALAHLHAQQRNLKHIVFTGSFLAHSGRSKFSFPIYGEAELHLHKRNAIAMRTLAYAVSFWSQEKRKAVFFRHEGFLGSIGALSNGLSIQNQTSKL